MTNDIQPGDRVQVCEGNEPHAGYCGKVIEADDHVALVRFAISGRTYLVPIADLRIVNSGLS